MTRLKLLLLCGALAPVTAFAQDTAVSPAAPNPATDAQALASDATPTGLEDIVVTARKSEERLQDVPVAITAFSAAEIKSARIENLSDLAKLTPGLNFTPLFGRQNQLPIIRGAAQTFGALNVGVFLDGIYLSGKAAVDLELNDLERIEVVKGPQSALYGRNTFAGAINYVTKRPTTEFSGNFEASFASFNTHKVVASVSGPLTDAVSFRAAGFYKDTDGFYLSAIDFGRVDFNRTYGFTGTLELRATEALTVTLRATYADEDSGQPASNVIRNNAFPGRPAGAPATTPRNLLFIGELPSFGRREVTVNTVNGGIQIGDYGDRQDAIRASGTVEWELGGVNLTSLTSYSRRNTEYTFDGDNTVCQLTTGCPNFGFPFAPGSNIPFGTSSFALSSQDGYSRDVSQELRLQSDGESDFNWLVGAFYYDNITSVLERSFAPITVAARGAFGFPKIETTTKSYAAFASASLRFAERFKLTGEIRYEYEEQTFTQAPTNPIVSTAASFARFDLSQDFDFVTPRVILDYQAMDDMLVYASYSRGAKTGGFNTNLNIAAEQRQYDPETSNNYEIGVKTDLFDRSVRFNVAGYYIDWNDQQAACQNPLSFGGSSTQRTYICNVAASTIYGAEVEVAARFSDWLSVAGNYTWTHARYDEFVDDSLAATRILAGLPPLDFDGNFLPYVPEHKFLISPRVTLPLGDTASAELRADFTYQSTTYLRADNLQNFGDKTNFDLRLTLRNDGGFRVQLFANNVLDNRRPVAGVRFFDSVNFSLASPLVQGADRRVVGGSVGYSF